MYRYNIPNIQMKGNHMKQTKFQKRFALHPKQNTVYFAKKKNQPSFVKKYGFTDKFNDSIRANKQEDVYKKSTSHLSLMNLGVEQGQKGIVTNSICTTKRFRVQNIKSEIKLKLLKLTNRRNPFFLANPFILTNSLQTTQSSFQPPTNKGINESKKQNFISLLKDSQSDKSKPFQSQIQKSKILKSIINSQQQKNDCLQYQNSIIKNRRKHKKKVLNLISNDSSLNSTQLNIGTKRISELQKMLLKYKFQFQNLRLNNIQNDPQTPILVEKIIHARYQTLHDNKVSSHMIDICKDNKISASVHNEGHQQLSKRKKSQDKYFNKKRKLNLGQKSKGFRGISPWNENQCEINQIQDIFLKVS